MRGEKLETKIARVYMREEGERKELKLYTPLKSAFMYRDVFPRKQATAIHLQSSYKSQHNDDS